MATWIEFRKDIKPLNRKTDVYHVFNKEFGTFLGTIKWYGSFRKYSFFPEPELVFEATCLEDLAAFLKELMIEHKNSKSNG